MLLNLTQQCSSSLTVGGQATMQDTLDVAGAATMQDALDVTGLASLMAVLMLMVMLL